MNDSKRSLLVQPPRVAYVRISHGHFSHYHSTFSRMGRPEVAAYGGEEPVQVSALPGAPLKPMSCRVPFRSDEPGGARFTRDMKRELRYGRAGAFPKFVEGVRSTVGRSLGSASRVAAAAPSAPALTGHKRGTLFVVHRESYHHRVVQPLRQPRRGFRGGDLEIRCGRTVPQCPVQFRYVKSRSDLESLTYAKSTNPTLTRQAQSRAECSLCRVADTNLQPD